MMARRALGLWLALVVAGWLLGNQHEKRFVGSTPRDRGDILLDVLGEFRTVMARYLWFKMDLFHEVLDDQGVAPSEQSEILPLLRMVSLLDPSMTDAYDNMAWDLYKGHRQVDQALEIISEGLERNPGSYGLHFRRALICYQNERYAPSLEAARQAVALAQDEFEALNGYRVLYRAALALEDRDAMRDALDGLQAARPNDPLWKTERAKLDAQP